MAVAIDAGSSAGYITSTGRTFSHTVSGSDRYLLVSLVVVSSSVTVTGVTYNGTAMTEIDQSNFEGGSFSRALFGLANPDTGTNNVVVSLSGSANHICTSVSLTGADSTQPDAWGGMARVNDNTDRGASVTSTIADCGIVSMGYMDNGGIVAGDSNTTLISGSTQSAITFGRTTTFPSSTAGTYTPTFDGVSGSWFQGYAVAVAPAVSTVSTFRGMFALVEKA